MSDYARFREVSKGEVLVSGSLHSGGGENNQVMLKHIVSIRAHNKGFDLV